MSAHCLDLAHVLEAMRNDIACRSSHDESTLVVSTGRFFSDGDAVELLVRPSEDGERVVISDGGLTSARLNLTDSGSTASRAKSLWADILAEFGVREISDRVFLQTKAGAIAAGISLVADACVALDSVHLLAAGERRTFTEKLQTWLVSEAHSVIVGSSVVDKFGSAQTVTAVVESPRGDVVVQAASGRRVTDLRSSLEHAFWVMSGLDDDSHPIANRLTVIEALPGRKNSQDTLRGLVRRVSDASCIGSFESQISVSRFLTSPTPPTDRDLVFESFGQIAAPLGFVRLGGGDGPTLAIDPPPAR